jgi:hypothetical protein
MQSIVQEGLGDAKECRGGKSVIEPPLPQADDVMTGAGGEKISNKMLFIHM